MDDVPLFEIDWNDQDIAAVRDSITRGGRWANGPNIEKFEQRIEEYLGVSQSIAVNSGTSALIASLMAHEIGPGDEVIVPAFTFIATVNSVETIGATPVFADIERDTYGLDPDSVRNSITSDTAAILPIHCYGASCNVRGLSKIARTNGVPLIEDAAEAFGADNNGKPVGTFGESAVLSFCQNKIITTGEGGAVVTDDPEIAKQVDLIRSHGRASDDYFTSSETGRYVKPGWNLRMSDLSAGLGCSQIARTEELIQRRRNVAEQLSDRIAKLPNIESHTSPYGRHVYQLYTITLSEAIDRDTVIDTLAERGIASKKYWDPPVHLTEYYRNEYGYRPGSLPVTEDVASRVLSLPMHPNLRIEEIDRIVDGVRHGIERSLATKGRP